MRLGAVRIAAGRKIVIGILSGRALVGRNACFIQPNALIHALTHIAE